MNVQFKSLRSSSSGNCLMVWTDHTTILLDCGIRTQRECRQVLGANLSRLDGVIVSHAHGDHICYSSLRVLGEMGARLHCHGDVLQQVQRKHVGDWDSPPGISAFAGASFRIGDFEIRPIELPHDPEFRTFGFVLTVGTKKIVVATDFHQAEAVAEHLVDADFIFIEANHDLDLLEKYWNYASTFHLNNRKTAELICRARKESRKRPQGVMLGHLSRQRNTDLLATGAVRERFVEEGVEMDFRLEVAPRYEPSGVVRVED